MTVMQFGALRTPGFCALGQGHGLHPFPGTPFSASGILPPLRSGQVSLDETEYFPAKSRSQRRYAPMVFGIIPERRSNSLRNKRSASPESPRSVPEPRLQGIRDHLVKCLCIRLAVSRTPRRQPHSLRRPVGVYPITFAFLPPRSPWSESAGRFAPYG